MDPELFLQAAQPLRDRRLCHLQSGGSVPEVAFLGDGDEESQVPDEIHGFQDGTPATISPANPPRMDKPTRSPLPVRLFVRHLAGVAGNGVRGVYQCRGGSDP
ncbi:hypothetical protein GONAM_20_01550 [Gordonia namibiensis NBRC 108229]|uniref:Uncharacterized protein n=1 Tax=Gordonia namibiensis NBRC 108229 TaxID=1208314 RepID=K6XQ97_9ACTN|nr:hypothetical protein GONAM_20_01550 [Gordonia namibiensis NBRC 108229]